MIICEALDTCEVRDCCENFHTQKYLNSLCKDVEFYGYLAELFFNSIWCELLKHLKAKIYLNYT
jgi:hypothetical protein